MLWLKHRMKTISWMLIASMLNLCLISTNVYSSQREVTAINHDDIELDNRHKLKEFVNRQDVQKQLQQYGLAKEEAHNRINALTDKEVAEIMVKIEQIPAGGYYGLEAIILIGLLLAYSLFSIIGCAFAFPFMEKNYGECFYDVCFSLYGSRKLNQLSQEDI